MARRSTWLVVSALAVIALVAAVDSLRGDGEEPASAPGTTTDSATTESVPAAAEPEAFGGVLYYTDEACELRAERLPARERVDTPNWDECRFVLSPDGDRVSGVGSGWDPHADPRRGRLFQSEGTTIRVATNGGPEGQPIRGTAAAWRPDGTLTYFADGAVREWPSGDIVLSQRDLVRALRALDIPELTARYDRFRVREAAWLDDRRLAAILSAEGPDFREDMLAIYDGTELGPYTFDGAGGLSDLRVSPGGRYAAAKSDGGRDAPGGFVWLEWERGELHTPRVDGFRALAWSPDDRWMAVAGNDGVFLYRPGLVPGPPELELDIDARDLAWRGTAEPPPLADTEEARDWLGGLPVSGRLFVTEAECRLRALRMPDLVWEEEPDGVEAPCRFTLDAVDTPLAEEVSVAPDGGLWATCRDGRLSVSGAQGHVADVPDACAPAWMPDGTLTFLRDGELWRGLREPRRLISRQATRRMFGGEAVLEEVAWLDDERVWAVVRTGADRVVIAAMTPERLVYSPTFTATRIENLVVSASGMLAAETDRGVVFFDQGGRRALSFLGARAVAWAPGALVAAVAGRREVFFVAPISREVVALPLAVEDLEWVVP